MSEKIPEWRDIEQKLNNGIKLTSLENFIYNNEPADFYGSKQFQKELKAVLEEDLKQTDYGIKLETELEDIKKENERLRNRNRLLYQKMWTKKMKEANK